MLKLHITNAYQDIDISLKDTTLSLSQQHYHISLLSLLTHRVCHRSLGDATQYIYTLLTYNTHEWLVDPYKLATFAMAEEFTRKCTSTVSAINHCGSTYLNTNKENIDLFLLSSRQSVRSSTWHLSLHDGCWHCWLCQTIWFHRCILPR